MQFASTRRKPNAFNLLHQLRMMQNGQEAFESVSLSDADDADSGICFVSVPNHIMD